jgi:hypothetical protein
MPDVLAPFEIITSVYQKSLSSLHCPSITIAFRDKPAFVIAT